MCLRVIVDERFFSIHNFVFCILQVQSCGMACLVRHHMYIVSTALCGILARMRLCMSNYVMNCIRKERRPEIV